MRRSSFLFLAASALLIAAALPLVAASDDLDVSFNTPGGYRATFSGDSQFEQTDSHSAQPLTLNSCGPQSRHTLAGQTHASRC